jgi:hypothetical protein
MSLDLTPITELDAINQMLRHIGVPSVDSVSSTDPYAVSARQILHEVSRAVQATGLECNTDTEYDLTRNVDNKIAVPTNALRIDCTSDSDLVARSGFFWDREDHTDVLDDDIEVTVVWFLDFEDLPDCARRYIAIKAGRMFQVNTVGSTELYKMTARDEQQAYEAFVEQQVEVGDYNLRNNTDMLDILR